MFAGTTSSFWAFATGEDFTPERPQTRPCTVFIDDAFQPDGANTILLAFLRGGMERDEADQS